MSAVIESFVAAYLREFDFYQEAARLCALRCEKLLEVNGIRAMVTFRAKRPDRLRDKLLKRDGEKNYSSEDEIRADVADLAGVRAALYFPGDREKFAKLVADAFAPFKTKEFPEPRPERTEKRFSGYHATHYRVRLRPDELTEAQRRYAEAPIEIQVASVLMHAWSEVEHDLIYKPATGELSEDEYAILDELNGLVLAGEIALERLQRAVENRVAQYGATFSNHYELAAFLYEQMKSRSAAAKAREPIMGRVDVLLGLLRLAQLDNAEALRPYLEDLDGDNEARPIADQIADRILAERSDLYQAFMDLQEKAGRNPYDRLPSSSDEKHELTGRFVSRWVVLERFQRNLAENATGARHSVLRPWRVTAQLLQQEGIESETLRKIETLRVVRNRIMHGTPVQDAATLQAALDDLESVLNLLNQSPNPKIKAAMRWAQSGGDESAAQAASTS
jgi:ppGpp synthetase/RelA/SpoT-type nucleotidyltranferase